MKRALIGTLFLCGATGLVFGQGSDAGLKFEIADVHLTPTSQNTNFRVPLAKGGRYEIKGATMVDLIRTAYAIDADKVLGGPAWLEMDRFDITGKLPPDSTPDTQKLMLQNLLGDRFQLKIHPDTKPFSSYALIVGKKPQMKEADGEGASGCKPTSSGAGGGGEAGFRTMVFVSASGGGASTPISFGPGMTIHYECRNITMESFAASLKGLVGVSLGTSPVKDETGLQGKWNFDLTFSLQGVSFSSNDTSEQISLFTALEKQAGLKLEERKIPQPVMVVESVNPAPSPNPPNLEEVMPSYPMPTEFDVASLKATDTSSPMGRLNLGIQPSGQFTATGFPLRTYIGLAFTGLPNDRLVGIPKWAESDRYDVIAKVPSRGPLGPPTDMDSVAPLLKKLLVERFRMTYHTEDRQVNGYVLTSSKPKLKKADPGNRTSCKTVNAPAGTPPGTRQLTCLNATVAQLAERLQYMLPDSSLPVVNATGIEGSYDFVVTFSGALTTSMRLGSAVAAVASAIGSAVPAAPAGGAPAAASDPSGGYTLTEALEKQLGLKLEMQKRSAPVLVIDHMEQKPIEN